MPSWRPRPGMASPPPCVVYDLSAGGKRVLRRAESYAHTFVAAVETFRDGVPTGERLGQLLRGASVDQAMQAS